MKAADITDDEFLAVMEAVRKPGLGAVLWDVQEAMPAYPPKVVHAKTKSMVRRRRITGCPCGCRGDFQPVQD